MKKLLVLLLVLGIASTANAITLTFSTSGSSAGNIADGGTIDLAVGSTTTLYVISDSAGVGAAYWTYLEMTLPHADASIPFAAVSVHANAGDLASKADGSSGSLMDYLLTAASTTNAIVAGEHFAFDVVISGSAATDGTDDFSFWNTGPSDTTYSTDKTVNVNIVPEPATIALLGLGGLFLLRRRKR